MIVTLRRYGQLMKPGIIFGNGVTTAAGFALASRTTFQIAPFLAVLCGVILVIGSACICNNYIDRKIDEKMTRTRHRPFVEGSVTAGSALMVVMTFSSLGLGCLLWFGNLLAASIAAFGFFVYVVIYSFMKPHSSHATLVGSIAGAVPPVIGYVAASPALDIGALILFAMMVLWQMPHFFAIASYRLDDYKAASIPILPLKKGMYITKIQMMLYILAFIPVSLMLFFCGYAGYIYLGSALLLGGAWFFLSIQGFRCLNDLEWARKMFILSLIVVIGLSATMPLS